MIIILFSSMVQVKNMYSEIKMLNVTIVINLRRFKLFAAAKESFIAVNNVKQKINLIMRMFVNLIKNQPTDYLSIIINYFNTKNK